MRKRLIEKMTNKKKGTLGYTLTEMLIVIGIIAIVCAIAIPSIISISKALRFAQANNYAKSIFLAAQQNLTELRSDGGLEPVQSAGGAYPIPADMTTFPGEYRAEYVYTSTGNDAFDLVLPPASIDGSVRGDQIIIEYNPLTGNIYAVFYCKNEDVNLVGEYDSGSLPREKAERRKKLVGYYDGSGLNSAQIELEQTQAMVEFINGEEGVVRVLVPMPESFFGEFSEFANSLTVTLDITGDYTVSKLTHGENVVPLTIDLDETDYDVGVDGKTVIYEISIDSLANRSSFVNYISDTQSSEPGVATSGASLTTLEDESAFANITEDAGGAKSIYQILPGENITIQANVTYSGAGEDVLRIAPGILSGVNPMFEYLQPSGSGDDRYVLAVSNGRNMQNLNAIAPTIAEKVDAVVFTSDIYWNDTVAYYNNLYGHSYVDTAENSGAGDGKCDTCKLSSAVVGAGKHFVSVADEAPARALPYFVPIHNAALFGTAEFKYGVQSWVTSLPDGPIKDLLLQIFESKSRVPTLTDEFDLVKHAAISGSDLTNNDGVQIYYLNIDSTRNCIGKDFYAGTPAAETDRFTGLFSYVNTTIDNLHIVNPIIKGYYFVGNNNPATGALVGAAGYNTYISNCSVRLEKIPGFSRDKMIGQTGYSQNADQNWYGVSGQGAVGGLVGYAKSHRTTAGALTADKDVLAFYNCFAAVNVSGDMRPVVQRGVKILFVDTTYYGYADKDYGYSNGVGGLIGNSQLTNFYNCYASGNVIATNTNAAETYKSEKSFLNGMANFFGVELEFNYSGRESSGAGGFVGSSHGTRYTKCFATGSVTAYNSETNLGTGGFVGAMCVDETFAYGNQNDELSNSQIAQRTVFTECYSVGLVSVDGSPAENFSGANCRVAFDIEEYGAAQVADYYRLLGRHLRYEDWTLPTYEDFYVYRDTYYLSKYLMDEEPNSNNCASPAAYATLQDLVGNHVNDEWIDEQITGIKSIVLYDLFNLGWVKKTYGETYFDDAGRVEEYYRQEYKKGFRTGWNVAETGTTHSYDLSGTYPFTKIAGLDYYGDWPAKPLSKGVAYYEAYKKGTSDEISDKAYHFDRETTSQLKNSDEYMVAEDGYAILSSSKTAMSITVNGVTKNFANQSADDTYTANNKAYHVYWLTDDQMDAAVNFVETTGQFYVAITVTQDGSTHTFYFNPCVAKSQINDSEDHPFADANQNGRCDTCNQAAGHTNHWSSHHTFMDGDQNGVCNICGGAQAHANHQPAAKEMLIRSARQFKAIASLENFWGSDYSYVQQMHIDAEAYEWSSTDYDVLSIGTEENPFNASYTGAYTEADTLEKKQYELSGFRPTEAGLFRVIGEEGVVTDLIVECSGAAVGSEGEENIAILAGVNNGIINKITLNITGPVSLTATAADAETKTNAGLLAGLSTGTVSDCTVTTNADAAVTISADNAGGLIGSLPGTENLAVLISDSPLTLGAALNIEDATNAGGYIGYAAYLTLEQPVVVLKTVDAEADYFGGLIGCAENTTITGSTDAAIKELKANTISSTGYAAGVLGSAKNAVLNGVDTEVKEISGDVAAGFLGTGENADADFCTVLVTKKITGKTGAAGVAGTVGPQSVFNHVSMNLSGVTVKATEGNAAGYALEIQGEASVLNSSVTLGAMTDNSTATIEAAKNAAGYACVISGNVGTSDVTGHGRISGAENAAGYAVTVNGAVERCHVSPAHGDTDYKDNANTNLRITGAKAAGFAMSVGQKATIANSYTLCHVNGTGTVEVETGSADAAETAQTTTVSASFGFAGTNEGTINRCVANVDIEGGFGFVGENNGLVTASYGWFGDGSNATASDKQTRAQMNGTGSCNNSYFADMAPENQKGNFVALYNKEGVCKMITAAALPTEYQNGQLANFVAPGAYASYPYTLYEAGENGTMEAEDYPYPMLRQHYGDWLTPPQYAYGVAYYEKVGEEYRVHMVDLSNAGKTVDSAYIPAGFDFAADTNSEISEWGYAWFYNAEVKQDEALFTKEIKVNDTVSFTYNFYSVEPGTVNIPATTKNSHTAAIDTRFADAILVDAEFTDAYVYQIRTPDQLANVADVSGANFNQTHHISVGEFAAVETFSGTYEGNGLSLTAASGNTWITTLSGTVQNVNLTVSGEATAPVFGTVGGTLELDSVNLGSVSESGALVGTAGGNVTTGAIESGAVSGTLFGTVSGTVQTAEIEVGEVSGKLFDTVSAGTVTIDSITTAGNAVIGQLFSAVSGGSVNVTNGITVGSVSGSVFGTVNSTVTTGAITVGTGEGENFVPGAVTGSVCAAPNGSITTGAITAGDVSGTLFGTADSAVNGTVQTAEIQVGEVSGSIVTAMGVNGKVKIGTVSGESFVPGTIQTGAVTGTVFGTANGTVQTGAITTGQVGAEGADASIFGAVTGGSVTVDSITTGGKAVYGKVFGDIGGTVDVNGAITLGKLNGQVFGAVNKKVEVDGTITVADASGSAAHWLIKSISGAAATLHDIQVSHEPVTTTTVEETDGKRTTEETTSYSSVPAMIGAISNGDLTVGDIDAGNVSASNWLIESVTSSIVALGDVTVHNGQTVVTIVEEANADGGMTETDRTKKTTWQNVSAMIGAINGGTVSDGTITEDTETASVIDLGGANISGSLFASVTNGATLADIHVATSGSMDASLIGDASGAAAIDDVDVEATGKASSFTGSGLLVNTLGENTEVSGCNVVTGEIPVTAQTFGGITGTVLNGAKLSDNTVEATLTVTGTANTVVGGLVGVNSGEIEMDENSLSNVTINYTQSEGDSATIGGLVGQMNGGTLTGTENSVSVTGAINLLKYEQSTDGTTVLVNGNGSGRTYIIGGAVGNLLAGSASTVDVNVVVDSDWRKAVQQASANTFGTSSITNQGPVGMFVGFAGAVTIENCASSETTNETFQFLGEAMISDMPLTNMWQSGVKQTGPVKAYSDRITDGAYASHDPAGMFFSAAASVSRVAPTISGCYFEFGGATMEQTYGADVYLYTYTPSKENKYDIGTSAVAPTVSSENKTYVRGDYKDKGYVPTGKYYLKDGVYYLASVVYSETRYLKDMQFSIVETGNEGNVLATKEAEYNWGKARYESTFTLHTITAPNLSGTYIPVLDSGKTMDATGNQYEVPATNAFEQRDDMYKCIWTVSGNTVTNVANDKVSFTMTATFNKSGTLVMSYTANGATFKLYPVTATANASAYDVLAFTYQNNADYQRQYVDAVPVDGVSKAALEDESNLPADSGEAPEGNETLETTETTDPTEPAVTE